MMDCKLGAAWCAVCGGYELFPTREVSRQKIFRFPPYPRHEVSIFLALNPHKIQTKTSLRWLLQGQENDADDHNIIIFEEMPASSSCNWTLSGVGRLTWVSTEVWVVGRIISIWRERASKACGERRAVGIHLHQRPDQEHQLHERVIVQTNSTSRITKPQHNRYC